MICLLALSVQDQVEEYGAYVGVAAFLGLALLSLLYVAQARELKRLREWAGRAPERARELEERVAAQAQVQSSRRFAREGVPEPVGVGVGVGVGAATVGGGRTGDVGPVVPVGTRLGENGEPPTEMTEPQEVTAGGSVNGDEPAEPAVARSKAEAEGDGEAPGAVAAGGGDGDGEKARPGAVAAGELEGPAAGEAGDTELPPRDLAAGNGAVAASTVNGFAAVDPGATEPFEPVPDEQLRAPDEEPAPTPPSPPLPRAGAEDGAGDALGPEDAVGAPGAKRLVPAPSASAGPGAIVPRATPVQQRPARPAPLMASRSSATVPPRRSVAPPTPLLTAEPPRRRWVAPVASLLAVLALAGGAFGAIQYLTREDDPAPARGREPRAAGERAQTPASTPSPPSRVRLVVLNATGITGVARERATELQQPDPGYRDIATGNASGAPRATSTVLFAEGARPEAVQLARRLRIAEVRALDAETAARARETGQPRPEVVLVVGADQQGAAPAAQQGAAPAAQQGSAPAAP